MSISRFPAAEAKFLVPMFVRDLQDLEPLAAVSKCISRRPRDRGSRLFSVQVSGLMKHLMQAI